MKIAYLDCFSGISGDMALGALLDAGLPFEELDKALHTLSLGEYTIEARREKRKSLSGTRFLVRIGEGHPRPRGLSEIREIIHGSHLSDTVKAKSIELFEHLAREEGRIHHRPMEEVHFHEVGATDSVIDIVGAVFGLEKLGIQSLFSSAIPLGSGFVDTVHGRIPLPAPATLALLKGHPVYDSGLAYEMVTPTGAALLKGLVQSFGKMPPMQVESIGYGVGTRDLPDRPNLLRIIIGPGQTAAQTDTVVVLEANLDDTNPEWLGFLMERLLEAGALDVSFFPAQMKKNRPGVLVQVMGRPHQEEPLMHILFQESTTLGIRFSYSQRKILQRSITEIESPWGKIKVKRVETPDGTPLFQPEYEACRNIAREYRRPIREIYYWVMSQNRT